MKDLIDNVVNWGIERNLIPGNTEKQYLKFLEELGETAKAILKNEHDGIIDGIGDVIVTGIIYFEQVKIPLTYRMFGGKVDEALEVSEIFNSLCIALNKSYEEDFGHFTTQLAYKLNLTPEQCLQAAWDEIKDRKGVTKNGTFIKEADLV